MLRCSEKSQRNQSLGKPARNATGSEHAFGDAPGLLAPDWYPMSTYPLFAALAIALLAGCAPSDETAGPEGAGSAPPEHDASAGTGEAAEDVIVSTNEPFWQARVEGDTVVLTGIDMAERRFSSARSAMTMDGRRVDASDAAGDVVLIVRSMRCEDDMSGARFPMTGLLTIDGRGPFRGCARPASMPPPQPPGDAAGDPASTTIPARFLGRWDADAAACKGEGSDLGLRIEPTALRFHESDATPRTVEMLDDDTIRIEATFEGEGETWQETRTLRLEGENTLVVEDAASTHATHRMRCD